MRSGYSQMSSHAARTGLNRQREAVSKQVIRFASLKKNTDPTQQNTSVAALNQDVSGVASVDL